jgi:Na+/proline symporter
MRVYLPVLLLLLHLPSAGQTKLYLQKVDDSTRVRPLRLNRVYHVASRHANYGHVRLTAIRDTLLVFTTKGKTKKTFQVSIAELRYIDTTPLLVRQLSEMGVMVLIIGQIPLIVSPFIGLLDNWQKAGEAVAFSGMLAGTGLALVSPLLFFKFYDLQKEWRIIRINP